MRHPHQHGLLATELAMQSHNAPRSGVPPVAQAPVARARPRWVEGPVREGDIGLCQCSIGLQPCSNEVGPGGYHNGICLCDDCLDELRNPEPMSVCSCAGCEATETARDALLGAGAMG